MTVKELKERLEKADENATVVIYDGIDEGDLFATTAIPTEKKFYDPYCKWGTVTGKLEKQTKLFVIAGFGCSFKYLNECLDERICSLVSKSD